MEGAEITVSGSLNVHGFCGFQEGEQFVKKIGGVFAFKVKDGPNGQEATWIVDVKNGSGCVHNDAGGKTCRLPLVRFRSKLEVCSLICFISVDYL